MPSPHALPVEQGDGRRWLIAVGTAHYHNLPDKDLPAVADDIERIADVFTRQLGFTRVAGLDLNPTGQALRVGLREFFRHSERLPTDLVVLYYAGHGDVLEGGEHVLLPTDADPDDAHVVTAADLARLTLEGSPVRRLLVLLDTCYSGMGNDQFAQAALKFLQLAAGDVEPGVVLISATRPRQEGLQGVFVTALIDAIGDPAVAGPSAPYLPITAVVRALNTQMPPYQRARLHALAIQGEFPPFLRNPRYRAGALGLDLDAQQRLRNQRQARDEELRSHFEPRSRGVEFETESGFFFTGRTRVLRDIAAWLRADAANPRALVVTGHPGSGKSAVLGRLVLLADPDHRPSVPLTQLPAETVPPRRSIHVAVHARGMTADDLIAALAAQARVEADSPKRLLEALSGRPQPLVAVIDALDETVDPAKIATEVLEPLISGAQMLRAGGQLRLLIGTRRHLVRRLGGSITVLDLDTPQYLARVDLVEYAQRCLRESIATSPYRDTPPERVTAVAEAVAEAAGQSFLVARLAARSLARKPWVADPRDKAWRRTLPTTAASAIERDLERLGDQWRRALDLLAPLAYAEGAGLPWEDLWAPLASAIAGREYTNADICWLRDTAGAYIVESLEQDHSVYRPWHQALTEYVAEYVRRTRQEADVQRAFADVLTEHSPLADDRAGGRDWARAHPYVRTHLAAHAAAAGRLDELITDPRYLLAAEPTRLVPVLAATRTPEARVAAEAYRRTVSDLRCRPAHEHAAYLELAARCMSAAPLAERIARWNPPRPWSASWAQWRTLHAHRVLRGHEDRIRIVAVGDLPGQPVAVSASDDRTVRVWDLTTGTLLHTLAGHQGRVFAVAVGDLHGQPTAVSASDDRTVRVWDLTTGTLLHTLAGHEGDVFAVAVGDLHGQPTAVSAGDDRTVRVWDLTTGRSLRTLTGHRSRVRAVALGQLNGQPIAVSASDDRTVRVWDLTTGTLLHTLAGHDGWVRAVALGQLDGQPVAVSASDDCTVRVWGLDTGAPVRTFTGHVRPVFAVAVGDLDDKPAIVSGGRDMTVRVWDPFTGIPAHIFTGHDGWVRGAAMGKLDGRSVVVSGGADKTVRVWDLASDASGSLATASMDTVRAVAVGRLNGQPVALSAGDDRTVSVWDLATGAPLRTLTGHVRPVFAVAVGRVNGRPVTVSGGSDMTVCVWDLATGAPLHTLSGHEGWIFGVAVGNLHGRPVAVSGAADRTLRVWDLATGAPLRTLTGHQGRVRAVAIGQINGQPVALSASDDHTVRLWDLSSGGPVRTLTGHQGRVRAVAIGQIEGQPVAISASDDRTVAMWPLTRTRRAWRQRPLRIIQQASGPVATVAVAPSAQRSVVVSGSDDGLVTVGDLFGSTQYTVEVKSAVHSLALGPAGTAVVGADAGILVLRLGLRANPTRRGPS